MASTTTIEVAGYRLATDRLYDPDTHLWVQPREEGRMRVGIDPLGRETMGDVVGLSLEADGTWLRRGDSLGDVEAAKFVGPLLAPLSGVVVRRNQELLASPGLLNVDPLAHWIVELHQQPADEAELGALLSDEADIAAWFAAEVARFRAQGALAE